ncbi:Phosphate transport system permease protein PstC 1 [Anaerolineae bacterium]|nr:Phosphate transport system permease protein PstC 1 [Anaerolineae bacterium]
MKDRTLAQEITAKPSGSEAIREAVYKYMFGTAGVAALLLILLIFVFLFREAFSAVSAIGLDRFFSLSHPVWNPTAAGEGSYSVIPLITGSLLVALPAVMIAGAVGILCGIYIAEVASQDTREYLKPILELLGAIPTIVLGFLIFTFVMPLVKMMFPGASHLNALLGALGIALMIIPTIASLTEESLHAVPMSLRMASYGLGATRLQTVLMVVLPGAVRGISSAVLLGFARALGETIIVVIVTGNAGIITADILSSTRTMTAAIVSEMGEVTEGSAHYSALFFIGIILFLFTFALNLWAEWLIGKKRKKGGEA